MTFVTGVVVAGSAPLSEFTTALVVQFCVGGGGFGGYTPRKPADRLHERTIEGNDDGEATATSCFN